MNDSRPTSNVSDTAASISDRTYYYIRKACNWIDRRPTQYSPARTSSNDVTHVQHTVEWMQVNQQKFKQLGGDERQWMVDCAKSTWLSQAVLSGAGLLVGYWFAKRVFPSSRVAQLAIPAVYGGFGLFAYTMITVADCQVAMLQNSNLPIAQDYRRSDPSTLASSNNMSGLPPATFNNNMTVEQSYAPDHLKERTSFSAVDDGRGVLDNTDGVEFTADASKTRTR